MLTSKQRAFLRTAGHQLPAAFQVGKGGITENILSQYDQYLTAHEIVKTHMLKNGEETPREAAEQIAAATGAEVVDVMGRKFILYRRSARLAEEGKGIILPREK